MCGYGTCYLLHLVRHALRNTFVLDRHNDLQCVCLNRQKDCKDHPAKSWNGAFEDIHTAFRQMGRDHSLSHIHPTNPPMECNPRQKARLLELWFCSLETRVLIQVRVITLTSVTLTGGWFYCFLCGLNIS